MNRRIVLCTVFATLSFVVSADTASPYAGQEARDIKTLSPQQVEGYLQGRGMGYAKAAELNHYPGPRHVLDLADELGLSTEQIEQTEAVYANMQSQAVALGKQLVDKEAELDQQFASGAVEAGALKDLLSAIASLDAELRYVHLSAHIAQQALLSRQQIQRYDQLRGYGASDHHGDHMH